MESEGYVAEFEYTVDDEGYVREATVATKIGDYGYVEIYTFIYEEYEFCGGCKEARQFALPGFFM